MARLIEKNHFIWLTLALIGLMITGAVSREISNSLVLKLIEFTNLALLLLSLLSLQTKRFWGKGFVFILGVMVAVMVVRSTTHVEFFEYFYLGLLLTFMLGAAWLVGSQVLLTGKVDSNIIVGSVALYLLIGLIWSIFYTIILEISPGSFAGIEAGMWYDNMPTMTYFSFVTLTTLGYGDISPINPMAEMIVALEAITGMFYIAVIVASLIGSNRDQS